MIIVVYRGHGMVFSSGYAFGLLYTNHRKICRLFFSQWYFLKHLSHGMVSSSGYAFGLLYHRYRNVWLPKTKCYVVKLSLRDGCGWRHGVMSRGVSQVEKGHILLEKKKIKIVSCEYDRCCKNETKNDFVRSHRASNSAGNTDLPRRVYSLVGIKHETCCNNNR